MFQNATPTLAIYDECYACAQAFHNSFKHLGFHLHLLTRDEHDLSLTLNLKPALLLFHLDSSKDDALQMVKKIKEHHSQLKLLAYTVYGDESYKKQLIKNGADAVLAGNIDLDLIIHKIISLVPSFAIKSDGLIISNGALLNISVNDPFYKILQDPKLMRLTELLANGKSTKEIASVMEYPESDIEKLRKKIIHETHCKNAVEYIGKAKDRQIV